MTITAPSTHPATRLLTTAALLGGSLLSTDAHAEGWTHLTPWNAVNPGENQGYGYEVETGEGWAFVLNIGDRTVDVHRRELGVWSRTQVIVDPEGDPENSNRFGETLKIDEGRLFVTNPRADVAGEDAGAVYVYRLAGDQWALSETITSASPAPDDRFGSELDVDGEWLVSRELSKFGDANVEVLRHDGNHWLAHATVDHPDAVMLGTSLAIRGTVDGVYANVFAGDTNAYGSQGAVFHFRVHPFGYSYGAVIQAPAPDSQDNFGSVVDFDGEHLAVSAILALQDGVDTGAVYVHDFDGEQLPPVVGPAVTLYPEPGQDDGHFGRDLEVEGDRIVVGAPNVFTSEVARAGAVYSFRPAIFGTGWQLEDKLTREGGEHGDSLGNAVALDGEFVLAGSWQANGFWVGEAVPFSLASREIDGGLAPSDVQASVDVYGQGKPGHMGVPDLHLSAPLVPGESTVVGLSNVPQGSAPFVFWSLAPGQVMFDGGMLLVADPMILPMPVVGPMQQVGVGWDLPADHDLAGMTIYAQAMLIDDQGWGPKKTAQSRGVAMTIGY